MQPLSVATTSSRVLMDRGVVFGKRPPETPLRQQRMKAWEPLLTPDWAIALLFVIGCIAIPIGSVLLHYANDVVEASVRYDDIASCGMNQWCFVNITIPSDMKPNIAVYYELRNFYQNHRLYVKSMSPDQLHGTLSDVGTCSPITQDATGRIVVPCGLRPYSRFNDTIEASVCNGELCTPLTGKDWDGFAIAWASDRWDVYKYVDANYSGPTYTNTYNGVTLPPVNDEDLIVWLRLAALSTFRKLYRRITLTTLPKGAELRLRIFNQFPVHAFSGEKHIVVTTTNMFGGKNLFLAIVYLVVGTICIAFSVIFQFVQVRKQRPLGDLSLFSDWAVAPQ